MEFTRQLSCRRPQRDGLEHFRTDAKCEDGRVVLAGHHLSSREWFILEVLPGQAPFLFDSKGRSSWASASAELLASWIALTVFGYLKPADCQRVLPIAISAGTDNRSNEFLGIKRSTTSWPLMLINMGLSLSLARSNLKLSLKWRPRDENVLADSLTNGDTSAVDPGLQRKVSWSDLDLEMVFQLWELREEFLDREGLKFWPSREGKRSKEKTPW